LAMVLIYLYKYYTIVRFCRYDFLLLGGFQR